MSREALEQYEQAHQSQLERNEARHIRTKVHEARQSPHVAGSRWPFELLQNALDVGPRAGRGSVTVSLRFDEGCAVFEHDGAPFASGELAALLSGGSSKDFESEQTTGRFGTGFLVTHVLAERTTLEGLLSVTTGYEAFRLELDRSGDEEAILANIARCNNAIEQAQLVPADTDAPSARFSYPIGDSSILATGIDAFRSALPYLYATRPDLGEVHVSDVNGREETWLPSPPERLTVGDASVTQRDIDVRSGDGLLIWRVLRVSHQDDAAAALVLLRPLGDGWEVVPPSPTAPRVYVRYPLGASSFVPMSFVFDGPFDPDEVRSRAPINDVNKRIFEEAFRSAATATEYASNQGWRNAHLLARAAEPMSGFNPDDREERSWWCERLLGFAQVVARLPVVETSMGMLPAIDVGDAWADIIAPRLLNEAGDLETTVDRMWSLVSQTTELLPPRREVAEDWTAIADGWEALGVDLKRITVQELGNWARKDVANVSDLRVTCEPHDWLARYVDVVGECWDRRGVRKEVLANLLPNQHGTLRSPNELRRGPLISDELKDICEAAGLDVRHGLLATQLAERADDATLAFASTALESAITSAVAPDAMVDELREHLTSLLPEDGECTAENLNGQSATARIFGYLWLTKAEAGASIAHKVPLATRAGKIVHWSSERMMMAPVGAWHEAARPFAAAYPPERILGDIYLDAEGVVVAALSSWGMAYSDPITTFTPRDLDGLRLAGMAATGVNTEGVIVRAETFSQIALLPREVINHIQSTEEARALVGLVLCHIAPHDELWRPPRPVQGFKSREGITVALYGALWLGDLRSRAWIPIRGEDEKPAKVAADATTLQPLLDGAWLRDNEAGIALLTECFGFDELELRLLGIEPTLRGQVRFGLARLLESGGADPQLYERLASEVEAKRRRERDIKRAQRLGYAVQAAVKQALESHGLAAELVDLGFDYEVSSGADLILDDAALLFTLGHYFVEVKATTTGSARLTPTQAMKASQHVAQYVLCVVDLREVEETRLDEEWTGADVEPLITMLGDIGARVSGTWKLVRDARNSVVGITNESALRYEVSPQVWEAGISLDDWMTVISTEPDLTP